MYIYCTLNNVYIFKINNNPYKPAVIAQWLYNPFIINLTSLKKNKLAIWCTIL